MFKANWEKTSTYVQLPQDMVRQMVHLAYPYKEHISHKLIAGGCGNLNYKILFENSERPLILRVYLRDRTAAQREQKIATLLKASIPIPLTYYIGEVAGYQFAITEFMSGISLRNLLMSDIPHNFSEVMYDVGKNLAKIGENVFPQAGFFDEKLAITLHASSENYLTFAKNCLEDKIVCSLLTP